MKNLTLDVIARNQLIIILANQEVPRAQLYPLYKALEKINWSPDELGKIQRSNGQLSTDAIPDKSIDLEDAEAGAVMAALNNWKFKPTEYEWQEKVAKAIE